jgi:hypothetical protein
MVSGPTARAWWPPVGIRTLFTIKVDCWIQPGTRLRWGRNMSLEERTASTLSIRFFLTLRTISDERVAVLLHLCQDENPARTSTVGTARPAMARLVLLACRLHLLERGLSEHTPSLPRATGLDVVRQAA